MQFVYDRVEAGGKPQPRLVEKRREFLAALRARDAELAARLMKNHLESVHKLLKDTFPPSNTARPTGRVFGSQKVDQL